MIWAVDPNLKKIINNQCLEVRHPRPGRATLAEPATRRPEGALSKPSLAPCFVSKGREVPGRPRKVVCKRAEMGHTSRPGGREHGDQRVLGYEPAAGFLAFVLMPCERAMFLRYQGDD